MKKDILILFLLSIILGMMIPNKYSKYDLNRDGVVNEQDLEKMQEYLCKE